MCKRCVQIQQRLHNDMSLTKNEFKVLQTLSNTGEKLTQRELADATGLSVGTINTTVRSCEKNGLVADGRIAREGMSALEPYRVNNAIIMAAGLSSRFVPLSYERPKGMLRVKGEVLIERQIKQLLKRGITDITVVVGYKKEYFFYLAAKYGVKILVNPEYAERNNSWTLWLARNQLSNTYVCSSDDYFTKNPFERYVYKSYYASEYAAGPTDEWCLKTGSNDRITGVTIGGRDSWVMLGQVYFDHEFSEKFIPLLEDAINRPETKDKLWESIYADNLKTLDMEIRRYPDGIIHEFDSLAELENFDPEFITNVDSEIFDNIVSVLGCSREEIRDFYPLKQGRIPAVIAPRREGRGSMGGRHYDTETKRRVVDLVRGGLTAAGAARLVAVELEDLALNDDVTGLWRQLADGEHSPLCNLAAHDDTAAAAHLAASVLQHVGKGLRR